jgi:peptidoglycan/LPS O-acetylase OafA/YrhL
MQCLRDANGRRVRMTVPAPSPDAPAPPQGARDIRALTSLRFFAALAVLLFHSGSSAVAQAGAPNAVVNLLSNGYLGVTFFFLLSGFILTYSYWDRLTGRADLPGFFVARFARLYPVYLLALALSFASYLPNAQLMDGLRIVSMTQAWTGPLSELPTHWNTPAWTLSVELAFYIAFPVLLPHLRRLGPRGLITSVLACCLLIILFRTPTFSPGSQGSLGDYPWLAHVPFPVLRAPEFILGACLGSMFMRGLLVPPSFTGPLAAVAVGLVMASTQGPMVAPAVCLGCAGLIMASAAHPKSWWSRALSNRLMVLLGGASYSLYILQNGVRSIMSQLFEGHAEIIGRLAYAPCLILLSLLVFKGFEEPIRRWTQRRFAGLAARRASVPAVSQPDGGVVGAEEGLTGRLGETAPMSALERGAIR